MFYKQLYILTSLVIKHCVDNKRAQHIKQCWEQLAKDYRASDNVQNIDKTFASLQKLSQAICTGCEVHAINDKTMAQLKDWATNLNQDIFNKRQMFLSQYIKQYTNKSYSAVYNKTA